MTTIELPDNVAAALAAAAAERGVTVDEFAAKALAEELGLAAGSGDALGAFIGSVETGDPHWASTDTSLLRKQADTPPRL